MTDFSLIETMRYDPETGIVRERLHLARLQRSAVGVFEPVARVGVEYRAGATASQVRDLIAMGPNAFHGVPDDVRGAEIGVSVTVSLFRKPSPACWISSTRKNMPS